MLSFDLGFDGEVANIDFALSYTRVSGRSRFLVESECLRVRDPFRSRAEPLLTDTGPFRQLSRCIHQHSDAPFATSQRVPHKEYRVSCLADHNSHLLSKGTHLDLVFVSFGLIPNPLVLPTDCSSSCSWKPVDLVLTKDDVRPIDGAEVLAAGDVELTVRLLFGLLSMV